MITHCEECDTYFRVSIDQLKAANGQVKCGCCMTVFNAIESLLEGASTASKHIPPDPALSPNTTIGSALLGSEDEESVLDLPTEEILLTIDDDVEESIDAEFTHVEPEILIIEDDNDTLPGERLSFSEADLSAFDVDEQNNTVAEETIKTSSSSLWFFTSLIMLCLLGYQFFNLNPELTLAKFPQLQPLCAFVNCPESNKPNDTSAINLVSRDVREHPQFQGVLLVNATLMNSAGSYQAFPMLQLDLFDKVGRPVGSRQFPPQEYLDNSVNLETGMKPKLPVHIVLEVLGSAEETSSFEFNFL